MEEAIWKPIPGYEGLYEVSNDGQVRSLFRYKKTLKPSPLTNGYLTVELWKGKKRKRIGIHRLVAMCFCQNPNNKPFVNHLDETRTNNRANNLEWVTHVENCNYGTAIARRLQHTDYKNRRVNKAELIEACSKPIGQYALDGHLIKTWTSASECCRANGWTISNVRRAATGEHKTAYGYIFKPIERSDDLFHA